ncbi:rCG21676 [Rattus norvegicus]|uniref:RCG21676 n=1 Tax=Rattus norvegicus TaxID=10116 RepID=A6J0T5_RAT|nr:rCG21676 [Rattus norvegicus]
MSHLPTVTCQHLCGHLLQLLRVSPLLRLLCSSALEMVGHRATGSQRGQNTQDEQVPGVFCP